MTGQDFPCDNASLGCDGRVVDEGTLCPSGCNCRALEREVHGLIAELPNVCEARVGRSARGAGGLVITVRYGTSFSTRFKVEFELRHELHLAIATALDGSDIARGHPYSLVIQ